MIKLMEGVIRQNRLKLFGKTLFEWNTTELQTMRDVPSKVWSEFGDLAREAKELLKEDEEEKEQAKQAAAKIRVIG